MLNMFKCLDCFYRSVTDGTGIFGSILHHLPDFQTINSSSLLGRKLVEGRVRDGLNLQNRSKAIKIGVENNF